MYVYKLYEGLDYGGQFVHIFYYESVIDKRKTWLCLHKDQVLCLS